MENRLLPEDALQFIEKMYSAAVLDKEGRYIYVNPSWLEASVQRGKNWQDVLGKKVTDIIPNSKAPYVLQYGIPLIGEFIPGSGTFTSYIPRLAPDGSLNGCYIYVILPEMLSAKALSHRIEALSNEVNYYKSELTQERGAKYDLDQIVGTSPAILKLKERILQAAPSTSTVLIEGETGTGKELIAHAIHTRSFRSAQNFVRVNCSAIPPELMESEFFGYASGAFTGASKKGKLGRFQLADKGSLFLDEVNLLPKTMQPKFLRTLQEREIDPVGGDKSLSIDVRLIAASSIPLEHLVERGEFRQDLYYRLNVIRISVPPLRERKEDIPLLVQGLIEKLNKQLGMLIRGVTPDVLHIFEDYDWPGNIRELQNALESAMNISRSPILIEDDFDRLMERISGIRKPGGFSPKGRNELRVSKADLERRMICEALQQNGGNKLKTAKSLGISRSVLYRKMKKFGIHLST